MMHQIEQEQCCSTAGAITAKAEKEEELHKHKIINMNGEIAH